MVTKRLHEVRGEGLGRLGRHVNHDPRSLAYQVKPKASLATSVLHELMIPVLDQGNLGSCTGNATTHALGTKGLFETLAPAQQTSLDEELARKIYSQGTAIDNYPGQWPNDDTGCDGLSVAKVATSMKLIGGYLHSTSLDAMITALQQVAVIVGVNWYEGFDKPDSNGNVSIAGHPRGGHEFCVLGVDVDAKRFRAVNSWSAAWGDNGYFSFSYADMDRLLHEQGDCTSFTAKTAPTPQPNVDPVDAGLMIEMDRWELGVLSRFTRAGRAKVAYDLWKNKKGYGALSTVREA